MKFNWVQFCLFIHPLFTTKGNFDVDPVTYNFKQVQPAETKAAVPLFATLYPNVM